MIHRIIATVAVTTALALVPANADPYAAGSKVEAFSAKTQHDKEFTLKPSETRFLLVTHDMETGKKANAVLTTVGPENLSGKKVVYLANIHGMPGVGRMFALPKMRKYSHTIILGDDSALIAKFPEEKNKVTVLKLSGGKVTSVKYWNPGVDPLEDFLK
ncbi:hypothetical protein HZ994_16380 [Akkermansiaceae bacterium]|nr:hypothetical protein HZ994_16380 [Akkermansiaceae bacterium]